MPSHDTDSAGGYGSPAAVERYTDYVDSLGLLDAERTVLREYFGDGARVLDLGCGAGRTTVHLADRGYDVVGVDVSEAMVAAARERLPDVPVEVGDAADLNFADDTFDHVLFSACGIDYLTPAAARGRALAEIRRVLRSEGSFAFSTHNCLYALPALFGDWRHLRNHYVDSGNWRRIGRPYKIDGEEYGLTTHVTHPVGVYRELRRAGFEFVAYVGKRDTPLRYLERRPYYVARKPARPSSDPP